MVTGLSITCNQPFFLFFLPFCSLLDASGLGPSLWGGFTATLRGRRRRMVCVCARVCPCLLFGNVCQECVTRLTLLPSTFSPNETNAIHGTKQILGFCTQVSRSHVLVGVPAFQARPPWLSGSPSLWCLCPPTTTSINDICF